MPRNYSKPPFQNEAQLGLIVANLFRKEGWKVLEQPRDPHGAPDFIVSKRGKKLLVKIKRAAEGRKDRVIPLLSQAVLEAVHYSGAIPAVPSLWRSSGRIVSLIRLPRKRFNSCGNEHGT